MIDKVLKWAGQRRFVFAFLLVNALIYILAPSEIVRKAGCGRGMEWYAPFIYHFFHANVWHLVVNSLAFLVLNPRAWVVGVGWVCAGVACMVPTAWGTPILYTHTCISDNYAYSLSSVVGMLSDYGGMGIELCGGDGWLYVSPLTVGSSAMYFAVLGRCYVERRLDMGWLLFLLLCYGMIPMVDWQIHLVSFVLGLMVWRLIKSFYTKVECENRYFWGRIVDSIHLTNDVKRKN